MIVGICRFEGTAVGFYRARTAMDSASPAPGPANLDLRRNLKLAIPSRSQLVPGREGQT